MIATMKKTYIIPKMRIHVVYHEQPLAASGVVSDKGIGYGGVDTEGTQDPDVKANNFDFEWE